MIRVLYGEGQEKTTQGSAQPETVTQLLTRLEIPLDNPCGGHGRCGKCRVYARGDLLAPESEEREKLTAQELDAGVRLACRAVLCGENVTIELPRRETMRVETGGVMQQGSWTPWAEGLGVCADIGTTTVAMYLWDLDRQARLGVEACQNPQAAFGADVVSRLEASLKGEGARLQACIVECLAALAERLCARAGKSPADIRGAVITGNTAMLYLLRGYPVEDLAFAPFACGHRFGEFAEAAALGLPWGAGAQVYLPPCISAYVGADISCGLLACDALSQTAPALLADVGTNGELALAVGGNIYCCATAAGPAFEGVGISCGCGAVDGAIDAVQTEDGHLRVHTIGGKKAVGLCGSGLLDAARCLRELELMEDTGYMEDDVRLAEGVSLTQRDIRALQLAKGAVCAGLETLLCHAGVAPSRVETMWLAGGFGSKLSPLSAAAVGLVPAALAPVIRPMGNTAAMGAALLLCRRETLHEISAITAAAETVELATSPVFQERFMEDMALKEAEQEWI